MTHRYRSLIILSAVALAACSQGSAQVLPINAGVMTPARLIEEPSAAPVRPTPVALSLPAQVKPLAAEDEKRASGSPLERIAKANKDARIQPAREGFINAVQVYPWTEGALYQVYTAPGQISDIALQPGEKLIGAGPIAAGDTVRWIIGDTISGTGALARVHILVKPVASRLSTNLVINTDRRTYHLELKSTPKAYMASVSWTYPHDDMLALRRASAEAERRAPIASGLDLGKLDFAYRISGDKPDWRPERVFDDGAQVFIAFPADIARGAMPPLFVLGEAGRAELVNYRVRKNHMIVDRLFEAAELRLGAKKQQVVRIERVKR